MAGVIFWLIDCIFTFWTYIHARVQKAQNLCFVQTVRDSLELKERNAAWLITQQEDGKVFLREEDASVIASRRQAIITGPGQLLHECGETTVMNVMLLL